MGYARQSPPWKSPTIWVPSAAVILAALIGGVFILVTALIAEEPQANFQEQPGEADFLGRGHAKLTAPDSLQKQGEGRVFLRVSLEEEVPWKDIKIVKAVLPIIDEDSQPASVTELYTRTARTYDKLLVFSRMCANLDAPAFEYDDHTCFERSLLRGRAEWVWPITEKTGQDGPKQVTVTIEANDATLAILPIIIKITPSITPTPAAIPPSPSPPRPTPEDEDAGNLGLIIGIIIVVVVIGGGIAFFAIRSRQPRV